MKNIIGRKETLLNNEESIVQHIEGFEIYGFNTVSQGTGVRKKELYISVGKAGYYDARIRFDTESLQLKDARSISKIGKKEDMALYIELIQLYNRYLKGILQGMTV